MDEQMAIERGLVGAVAGDQVVMRNAGAGAIAAKGNVTLTNGGAGAIAARGDVTITNGGGGPMAAVGGISITNGGAQTIATLGGATLGERSFVALVLSPKVAMAEGATVLMSTPQALAFGAVAGVVFGFLTRRRRRR